MTRTLRTLTAGTALLTLLWTADAFAGRGGGMRGGGGGFGGGMRGGMGMGGMGGMGGMRGSMGGMPGGMGGMPGGMGGMNRGMGGMGGGMPNRGGFNNNPSGAGLRNNPTGAGFGNNPTGAGFRNNPSGAGFGNNPTGAGFRNNPSGAGFNNAPQLGNRNVGAGNVGLGNRNIGAGNIGSGNRVGNANAINRGGDVGIGSGAELGNRNINTGNINAGNRVVNNTVNRPVNVSGNGNNLANANGGWRGQYDGYHPNIGNGYWNGNHSNGWGYGLAYGAGYNRGYGAGALTTAGLGLAGYGLGWGLGGLGYGGIGAWGWGSPTYAWGYAGYSNPYYDNTYATSYYGQAASTPAYSYAEPINTTAAPPEQSVTDKATAIFDQGVAAFKTNDYAPALKQTQQALALMPNDATLHEFLGLVLFAQRQYEQAAAPLHAVLSVGPGWNWTTLSGMYPDVATYTDQIRALESYVKKDPKSANARFVLAYHYLCQGHDEAAITELKDVLKLKPDDALSKQLVAQFQPGKVPAAEAPDAGAPAPAAAPEKEGKLAGNWTARPAKGTSIALKIKDDGAFTWTVNAAPKPAATIDGTSQLADGVLTLQAKEGTQGALAGKVAWKDDDHFTFRLLGGPPDDPGLSFAR